MLGPQYLQTSDILPCIPGVGIRDPGALLGIVWLGLDRMLQFDGRQQELCRVEVSGPLHQLDVARHVGVEWSGPLYNILS